MIGPRFPDLYQVSEEKRELYSKMALLLFKPHRNSNDVLLENCSYTASFDAFRTTEYYTNSEADHILTNIQQYYTGKRRAKELRELENSHKDEESFLFSDSDDETDDGRDDQEETEQLNFEMNDAAFESNVTEFSNQNLAQDAKIIQNSISAVIKRLRTVYSVHELSGIQRNDAIDEIQEIVKHTTRSQLCLQNSAHVQLWPQCSSLAKINLDLRSVKETYKTFELNGRKRVL